LNRFARADLTRLDAEPCRGFPVAFRRSQNLQRLLQREERVARIASLLVAPQLFDEEDVPVRRLDAHMRRDNRLALFRSYRAGETRSTLEPPLLLHALDSDRDLER